MIRLLRGTPDGEQQSELPWAGLADTDTLARQYSQAYAAALALTRSAPERIRMEIERIRTGDVAHYDFLQYEHFEMLRHARALSIPPANIDAEERAELLSQAAEWKQTAELYELMIDDFLCAQAVALAARSIYRICYAPSHSVQMRKQKPCLPEPIRAC